jgi:hypothetical protein
VDWVLSKPGGNIGVDDGEGIHSWIMDLNGLCMRETLSPFVIILAM